MQSGVRILRIKTEETFGHEYEIAPRYYDLYADGDSYFVVRSRIDGLGKRRRSKADLDPVIVAGLLQRLARVRVPAAPEFPMGCDGGFTTLTVAGYWGSARFRWWSAPPRGYGSMARLVDEFRRLFDGTCDRGASG